MLEYYEKLRNASPEELRQMWEETTREDYNEMLEVLPPARWNGPAFLVGECLTHGKAGAIYEAFTCVKGRHFKRPAPYHQFDANAYTDEIRAQFKI